MDIEWLGVNEFGAAVEKMAVRATAASTTAVAAAAHELQRGAMERSPVLTGTLRRSIHVEGPRRVGAFGAEASIGPTAVYGRRIELGFRGADRLGRHYNQSPKPYMRPAFDEVRGRLSKIMAASWGAALKL